MISILDLIVRVGFAESKSDARRKIRSNGMYINDIKIESELGIVGVVPQNNMVVYFEPDRYLEFHTNGEVYECDYFGELSFNNIKGVSNEI